MKLQDVSEEHIDVKPQDTSGHTMQVDSIDIMDVDSNNNEEYMLYVAIAV